MCHRWYWLSTEQLHSQQGKDYDEEEEEEEQADDGLHGVQQRDHQVTKRSPVPEEEKENMLDGAKRNRDEKM